MRGAEAGIEYGLFQMNSSQSSCHAGAVSEDDTERLTFLQNDKRYITRIARYVPPCNQWFRTVRHVTKLITAGLHDALWATLKAILRGRQTSHWYDGVQPQRPGLRQVRKRNFSFSHVVQGSSSSHPSSYSIFPTSARVEQPQTQSEQPFNSVTKFQNVWSFTFTPPIRFCVPVINSTTRTPLPLRSLLL
jgi:hypothetical protein